jgi:hypothetical protein
MNPWIQIEWHIPTSEGYWTDFVAYLAAPVSSNHPMALRRQAQGRTDPWIDAFDELILELGNEPWQNGSIAAFWVTTVAFAGTTEGETYGIHCKAIIDEMKTSPYYSALRAKMKFIGSGWPGFNNAFGLDALAACPDLDGTSAPAYNGGWEKTNIPSTEDSATFQRILVYESDFGYWEAFVNDAAELNRFFALYESGPGYQTRFTIVQEVVNKSRAMGTATLGSFALRAAAGAVYDNFFRIDPGAFWTSHALDGEGGGTFPAYGLLKMVWDAVGPSRVEKLGLTGSVPLDGDDNELIQAFRFKSIATPSTQVIVVVNRDIDVSLLETEDPLYSATPSGKHLVTVRTGLVSCTGMEYYGNTGNFREHNRYTPGYRQNLSINFDAGTNEIFAGDLITGATSGVTARVENVTVSSGSWGGGNAAGTLRLLRINEIVNAGVIKSLQNDEIITSASGSATTNEVAFSTGPQYNVVDPLCVVIDYDWTTGTAPSDPFLLEINDDFGAESDGLRAGNCVLIKLTGCTP